MLILGLILKTKFCGLVLGLAIGRPWPYDCGMAMALAVRFGLGQKVKAKGLVGLL